jgi:hypothetical protein
MRKKLVGGVEKIAGQTLEGAEAGGFYSYFSLFHCS